MSAHNVDLAQNGSAQSAEMRKNRAHFPRGLPYHPSVSGRWRSIVSSTIGLIGGMSWESTATYYREINELTRQRHGGLVSAEILMHSVNFKTIVDFQRAGRWDLATERLSAIGHKLTTAGAGCILICTNTMHLVADDVARRISAPLINIIDVTGAALEAAGARRPLLLATRYTMEHGFYLKRLSENSNLTALTPGDDDRGVLH